MTARTRELGANQPASCTVELSTGSFVALAHQPIEINGIRRRYEEELAQHRAMGAEGGYPPSPLMGFERQTGGPEGVQWRSVWLDITQIVAVYPVNTRPEPARVNSVLTVGGLVPS